MILLDPDLDDDPAPGDLKGATLHDSLNMERKLRVPSARTLSRFLSEAQAAVRLRGLVSVLLTTDTAIRRLNRTFRGKNKATDVLSFPAGEGSRGEVAGDLAISIPIARKQAGEQGHALAVELKVLMLHGLLHLAGFDHETDAGKMERRERMLRARLGLPSGLIERSSLPTLAPEKRRKSGARKLIGLGSSPTLSPEKRRKDGARKLIGLGSSPTLSPKSRRKDGAPGMVKRSSLPTLALERRRKDGARSVSAGPVESMRATARPKADRAKLAGGRA